MASPAAADAAIAQAMRGLIRAYQLLIAPLLPPSCRYWPSCSHYAAEAIAVHGSRHGLGLAARRLLRCHPWGGSGYDPVPPATHRNKGVGNKGVGNKDVGNKDVGKLC